MRVTLRLVASALVALILVGGGLAALYPYMMRGNYTAERILNLGGCFAAMCMLIVALLDLGGVFEGSNRPSTPIVAKATLFIAALLTEILTVQRSSFLIDVQEHMLADEIGSLDRIEGQLDPEMKRIYGSTIHDAKEQLRSAIELRSVRFDDMRRFGLMYEHVLQEYPEAHLIATSLPSANYFWGPTQQAMARDYVSTKNNKHGRMTRMFFVGPDDCSAASLTVMRDQQGFGVKVYVLPYEGLGVDYKLQLFDEQMRFGWEVWAKPDSRLSRVELTTSPREVANYAAVWKRLLARNPMDLETWQRRCDAGSVP